MTDRTNVPNPHQQTVRYGHFDPEAVLARVEADRQATRQVLPGAVCAAVVTHLNETDGKLDCETPLRDFTACFDRACLSFSPWEISN